MVTLREVLHDARQCVVARTVRSALLAATMVVVCAIGTFLASANDSLQTGLRGDAERHFVPIADSLAEPAAFEEYSSPEGIARAAAFYNALNTVLSGGSFLSVFDQQVAVRSDETWHPYAAGPDGQAGPPAEYFHPAMGGQVLDVRSVQLNKNAWDFYGLRLAEGAGPLEWGDVDYRGAGPHPVILGANLRGVAEVGDTIKIGFYNTVFEFRVVGFLTPRSMIYLRGDFNYSLDDTVVIPYPMMLDPAGASGDAEQFLRILTFAMISGNIALNDGETFDTIASEIAGLAQRARFHEYSLLGAAPYLTQFRSVRALVRSNTVLVGSSFAAVAAIVLLLAAWVSLHLSRVRSIRDQVLWGVGVPRREILALRLWGNAVYWGLSCVLFCIGALGLPGHDSAALALVGVVAVTYWLAETMLELSLVKRVCG